MDIVVSDKHKDINKKIIEDIFINGLRASFIFSCSSKILWNNEFDTILDDDELVYYLEEFVNKYFDTENDKTIFEFYNIPYEMDYKTFLFMCKYVKQDFDDYCITEEKDFSELFNMDTNTEIEIINNYAYFYISKKITETPILDHSIIDLYRNIAKYNYHNNKHSGLIRLYNKLDILNKKKIVIEKILHDKFDTDILENILQSYGSEYNSDLED